MTTSPTTETRAARAPGSPAQATERGLSAGVALVSGADRGLGHAVAAGLAREGWRVFAGRYLDDWPGVDELAALFPELIIPVALDVADLASCRAAAELVQARAGRLDLLISNAGINSPDRDSSIRDGLDYDELHRLYDVNSLGALRLCESFVPLMAASDARRLCFVSSEAASTERAYRKSWYNYCMSKSALNMAVKILHNELRGSGFTFRLYHPGGIRSWIGGTGVRSEKREGGSPEPEEAAVPALAYFLGDVEDEDVLVMRDHRGQEWPW